MPYAARVPDVVGNGPFCFILRELMRGSEGRTNGRLTRSILYALLATLLALSPAQSQTFTAQQVASGLNQPLYVTAPPGDVNHLFIVQQTGQILLLDLQTGVVNPKPFFNIRRLITSGGEQGLLGMAFDPNYAVNQKFYLNFTAPGGAFGNGVTHISQFQVQPRRPGKRRKKKRIREKVLLTFDQPQINHNGGWIGFSPRSGDENNLYIATGDGGASNDQGSGHIEPGGNAQNNAKLLGKILRVHVESTSATISIPPGNPFFGSSALRPEIWVFGLRNPYRASFDRQNGRMFIGDVGQNTREEIDVEEASNPGGGENYQWRLREGTIATPTGNPPVGGAVPPGSVGPILDYGRATGGTVIGGYVYRGTAVPALQGKYVFGDFVSGRIFTLDYNGTTASNFQDITSQLFPTRQGGFNLSNLSSFGEDASGELYIIDLAGSVFKIVP